MVILSDFPQLCDWTNQLFTFDSELLLSYSGSSWLCMPKHTQDPSEPQEQDQNHQPLPQTQCANSIPLSF